MSEATTMSKRVCEWCGAADEYHDYEHLSRECWPKRFEALTRQLAQAQEENYRLRRVLKEIEWRGHDPNENGDVCPWCGWEKRDGHRPDCELAAVLVDALNNLGGVQDALA